MTYVLLARAPRGLRFDAHIARRLVGERLEHAGGRMRIAATCLEADGTISAELEPTKTEHDPRAGQGALF